MIGNVVNCYTVAIKKNSGEQWRIMFPLDLEEITYQSVSMHAHS